VDTIRRDNAVGVIARAPPDDYTETTNAHSLLGSGLETSPSWYSFTISNSSHPSCLIGCAVLKTPSGLHGKSTVDQASDMYRPPIFG
jgi:hypothetical protein